jgi:hypothetical protein
MGWVRRLRSRGDVSEAQTGIASDFADFLAHATEGGALTQAIVDASQPEPSQPTPDTYSFGQQAPRRTDARTQDQARRGSPEPNS